MAPDFKAGAVNYVDKLGPDHVRHLYTKPFAMGPEGGPDSAARFHDFANIISVLRLSSPKNILDMGCGPGWLSEFLARLGHRVTGVDLCPAMIEIARARVAAVPYTADGERPRVRFLVQDAEELRLPERYHVAILYDSFHHFENKARVIATMHDVLAPGGRLLIHEGVRPPRGSREEAELARVMAEYETLEAPVEHAELLALLKATGFAPIDAYVPINGLYPTGASGRALLLQQLAREPWMNIIVARKRGRGVVDSEDPGVLRAQLQLLRGVESCRPGETVELEVRVKNTGDTLWLAEPDDCGGFVSLGGKLLDAEDRLLSDTLPRSLLPAAVAPGETATLRMTFPAPEQPGRYVVKLDMVDELIAWFEDRGSAPARLSLRVTGDAGGPR